MGRHQGAASAPRRSHEDPAYLLDGNVLVALMFERHLHHSAAQAWFTRQPRRFATCPITQGTLLRLCLMLGVTGTVQDALAGLRVITEHPRHLFWSDSLGYLDIRTRGLQGHRQITDAYLAALARHHGGRLATFDRGLAALHPDVAERVA